MRRIALAPLPILAIVLAAPEGASAPPSREVARTVALEKDGTVAIDTYKGSVKVRTWDRAEVSVAARIEADGDCGDLAKAVEATDVVVEAQGSSVRIRSDYDRLPKWSSWWGGSCSNRPFVHYDIQLPRTAALRLEDYKSDSTIDGLEADLDVETYKGDVRITRHGGGLTVETYKGDVRAELARVVRPVSGETYKGTIVIGVPKDAGVTPDLEADRGEADARPLGLATEAAGKRGERVHGAVNGGGPRVSLKTYKGSVRLAGL